MYINGPAGRLEANLDQASAEKTITAVLCHPHPQYGGSMHDMVLQTAVDVLLANGINCLRFNFRGVGASEGSFAQGAGEADDLMAVVGWQQEEYPRDRLWLCGYSFGAAVVWRGLAAAAPQRAILIAPPLGMMDFTATGPQDTQLDAIAGDRDEYVDQSLFAGWEGVTTHPVSGADHFFSGGHQALRDTLAHIVGQ